VRVLLSNGITRVRRPALKHGDPVMNNIKTLIHELGVQQVYIKLKRNIAILSMLALYILVSRMEYTDCLNYGVCS